MNMQKKMDGGAIEQHGKTFNQMNGAISMPNNIMLNGNNVANHSIQNGINMHNRINMPHNQVNSQLTDIYHPQVQNDQFYQPENKEQSESHIHLSQVKSETDKSKRIIESFGTLNMSNLDGTSTQKSKTIKVGSISKKN